MNKISLFFIVTGSSLFATAQQFSAGITGGTGLAWTRHPPSAYYGPLETVKKQTTNFGVQMLLRASTHIYFGGNIVFSNEGFTFGDSKKPNYVNFEMEYIRLNVQPVYYPLKKTSVIQPKISAGLSGAYLKDGYSAFTDNAGNHFTYETREIVKSRFDMGYRLEAGVDIRLNRSIRLTTGAAYYNGTMRVPDFNRKWENRNMTYNAGFLIRTSRK